jgi:O-antigen/teichoic acid export membrane protein
MIIEARATVRNAGLLVAQQGVNLASALCFATLAPRLMGPEVYGRYALVTSLSLWFVAASGLGFAPMVGRYIPQFAPEGAHLRLFFGRLLTTRLLTGAVAAGLYLLLTTLWLRDLDPLVLATMAGVIAVQALSQLYFSLFLGLNQAARWGMETVIRGWASLILMLPGFYLGGLRGACLGLLLAELVVFSTGAWWARASLAWHRPRADLRGLAPYFRFWSIFFVTDLLFTAFQYSGPSMVRAISGDYAQVAYFGAAFSVYRLIASLLPQLTLSFAPLLLSLLAAGQTQAIQDWVERLLKALALVGVLIVFGVLLLGDDLVPAVLGAAYRPVVANLLPLSLTALALGLINVMRLLAVVYDQPGVVAKASGLRLVTFWGLGLPLVTWLGGVGGCLAVLIASVVSGMVATWRMRPVSGACSLRSWAFIIALGGLFLPLVWLRGSLAVNAVLYGLFVAGYATLLLAGRAITPGEIAAIWQAVGLKGPGLKSGQGIEEL